MPFLVRPSQPENLHVSVAESDLLGSFSTCMVASDCSAKVPIGSKRKRGILGNNPRQVRLSMLNGSQSQRNFTRTESMPVLPSAAYQASTSATVTRQDSNLAHASAYCASPFLRSSLPSNSIFRSGITPPIWWICSFRLNGPGYKLDKVKLFGGNFDGNLFMLNNFRCIFDFDEASLNSNSSVSITPSQSTMTITDSSIPSSGTQGSYAAIFEDHSALNSSSEHIVELHCSIREQLGKLMPNKNSQDVLVAAEALHGKSNEIPFLEHLLEDLTNNEVACEAFRDAMDLAGIVASSPLEQFTILPLIPMKIGNLGGNSVPNAWQSLVELLYDFVLNPELGADEAFLLSSRSALAPDLELTVLGLRPGFFLESLPF
ncbi:hypothetical protein M9H77_23533 [Catharanthus roseus]|uniref:Uncharacterized protein n=1 Tax=Catharanthus roseus TaxID=4058 RepID=A0ACC0ATL6_CATRO|nr:hypothetical protein M9H77_23533 [Catharanthus roseus]